MPRGQVLNIPNSTAVLTTTLSKEEKASIALLNPNDGILYVKLNGNASNTPTMWDWKVPSQSYCQLPGPWQSLGVYYQDQSGGGAPAQVNVYESDSDISIPSFIAIGRAIQTAGTMMDISTGSQPQNPPANTIRLWADGSGNLHFVDSSGNDQIVIDSTTPLGGDLTGTVPNGHVLLQNNSQISGYDGTGISRRLLLLDASNPGNTYLMSPGGNIMFRNDVGGATLAYFDNTGTLHMNNGTYIAWSDCSITRWNPTQLRLIGTGGITIQGPTVVEGSSNFTVGTGTTTLGGPMQLNSNLTVTGSPNFTYGALQLGTVSMQNWNTGQLRITTGGISTNGDVNVESDFKVSFAVNGYYWKGINGYPCVYTNGDVGVGNGHIWLSTALSAPAEIYWDGTNIHIPPGSGFVSESHIYNRSGDGNYYTGTGDQTSFGVWNPGELRVKSSPGNFMATGYIQAIGAPCHGNGAYVNDASSRTIKGNIVELDSANSLKIILDARMRPVEYEYLNPIPRHKYTDPALTEPDPLAPDVIWTDRKLGFIAEEVSNVVPHAAGIIEGTNIGHGLSVEMLVPVLWSAVRELDARIKRLETPAITV